MTFSLLVLPKSGHHTSTAFADVLIAFGSIAQRPHFDELLPGQLPPCEQAAAIPPGVIVSPTQKLSGVLAFKVGFVVAYVSARCREAKFGRRPRAAIPGLVAVLETCLATIGAIAAGSLELGKLRHDRTRRRRCRPSGSLSGRLSGWCCPATYTSVCRLHRLVRWPRHLARRLDGDAGKRGRRAWYGLRHCRTGEATQQRS
jgi:hypothetical protein